jgi:hypothetical protein
MTAAALLLSLCALIAAGTLALAPTLAPVPVRAHRDRRRR